MFKILIRTTLLGLLLVLMTNLAIAENSLIVRENSQTVTVTDANNRAIVLKKLPKRVIIAYASYVGLWYCAGGKTVGIPTTRSNKVFPKAAKDVPRIGSFANPSVEKILTLRPDLVLLNYNVSSHRRIASLLAQNNIQTLMIKYDNYGDFKQLLELFCTLNGHKLANNQIAINVIKSVNKIMGQAVAKPPLRFICLFSSGRGVSVEDSTTNTAYMAKLLGGINIVDATKIKGKRIRFSLEKIVIDDPDIIFVTTMGNSKKLRAKMHQEFMSRSIWKSLSAVKNHRVYFLDNYLFLYKANLNYPLAFKKLAKLMYPTPHPKEQL